MSRARTLAGAIGSDGALNVADVAGLAAVASSGSASDLTTGTLALARLPNGGLELGTRNRLINGDFSVWQRGTSRYTNWNVVASAKYYADRWTSGQYQNASFERVDRTGTGPTSSYAMRVSSNTLSETGSTGTRMSLGQMIESINCIDLAGSPVTMSFWIRFAAASFPNFGVFTYGIWQMNAVDPSFDTSGPDANQQINIANGSLPTSWTKLSVTYTPTSSMKNLVARFSFDSLATTATTGQLWYEVAEVQLEPGSVATPFERRSYGAELALCQRYFQRNQRCNGYAIGTSAAVFNLYFPVIMRTTPSAALTTSSPYIENIPWASISTTSGFTVNAGHISASGGDCRLDGTMSGVSDGQRLNIGGDQILFSAEL